MTWAREPFAKLEPHARGAYVNFLGEEGDARTRAAYGEATYRRLAALKRRYDPDNVFRLNQNIVPDEGVLERRQSGRPAFTRAARSASAKRQPPAGRRCGYGRRDPLIASQSTRFICAALARSGALRSSVRDIRAAVVLSGFSWRSVTSDASAR